MDPTIPCDMCGSRIDVFRAAKFYDERASGVMYPCGDVFCIPCLKRLREEIQKARAQEESCTS